MTRTQCIKSQTDLLHSSVMGYLYTYYLVYSQFHDHWPQSTHQYQTLGLHDVGVSPQFWYIALLPKVHENT